MALCQTGGALVVLLSANSAATVPPTVLIPEGQNSADFPIATTAVAAAVTGNIKAKFAGTQKSAALTVRPIGPASLSLSPTSVVGGSPSTGTVTLDLPAAPGNVTVNLTSSIGAATVPASITIPVGETVGTFTVSTTVVTATKSAVIKAAAGGVNKKATLTITK